MNSIAQEAHFRQRVLKYSFKKGVTEAARRYHLSRKTIYTWRKRYDGTWKSLVERSHRPHWLIIIGNTYEQIESVHFQVLL